MNGEELFDGQGPQRKQTVFSVAKRSFTFAPIRRARGVRCKASQRSGSILQRRQQRRFVCSLETHVKARLAIKRHFVGINKKPHQQGVPIGYPARWQEYADSVCPDISRHRRMLWQAHCSAAESPQYVEKKLVFVPAMRGNVTRYSGQSALTARYAGQLFGRKSVHYPTEWVNLCPLCVHLYRYLPCTTSSAIIATIPWTASPQVTNIGPLNTLLSLIHI